MLRHIYLALHFLEEHPEASERTDDPDIRVKIVTRYRYKIFYAGGSEAIEILHIRHSAQRDWRRDSDA